MNLKNVKTQWHAYFKAQSIICSDESLRELEKFLRTMHILTNSLSLQNVNNSRIKLHFNSTELSTSQEASSNEATR
jgi:hypothetical protein